MTSIYGMSCPFTLFVIDRIAFSSETVAMDRAVEEIVRRVGDDTLVIVTADHSHTLSVSGYPGRRADITGVVKSDNGWIMRADDGHTMSILR